MIELYTSATPNGHKASVTLEELAIPYQVFPINLSANDQKSSAFLDMNPNGRIPVIKDKGNNDLTIFESGAIMIYLAEKTGQLLPSKGPARSEVMQWLMFQMGGVGPTFGQVHHFKRAAKEKVPYGINRYFTECLRLYGVLNARLEGREYLAGDISIADFATLPWVFRYDWQEVDLADFPNVARWYETLMARPALARGMELP